MALGASFTSPVREKSGVPSATELLAIENGTEAGIVGGVAALLAGTIVTALGSGIDNPGLAIGGLTALLFFLVLVALNVSRVSCVKFRR